MAKLEWDKTGERLFETGVDRGVLFPYGSDGYKEGIVWNGLTAVTSKPSGAEPTALWADNQKYLTLMSSEEYGLTIESYMYPDEFKACNGESELADGVVIGGQKREMFGFSYRTKVGNDVDDSDHGYKIHLVYGCRAAASEKQYSTINDSPEAMTMSWEVSTTPVEMSGHRPVAHIEIDSTKVDATKLASFEKILYGSDAGEGGTPAATTSKLPLPAEVAAHFAAK